MEVDLPAMDGIVATARIRALRIRNEVDRRAVMRAAIVALPIRRGRVVDLGEELEQRSVAHHGRSEDDLYRLGMGAMVSIGGIYRIATGPANPRRHNTGHLADQVLHVSEAATRQNRRSVVISNPSFSKGGTGVRLREIGCAPHTRVDAGMWSEGFT